MVCLFRRTCPGRALPIVEKGRNTRPDSAHGAANAFAQRAPDQPHHSENPAHIAYRRSSGCHVKPLQGISRQSLRFSLTAPGLR
jgi:hypothetical protein